MTGELIEATLEEVCSLVTDGTHDSPKLQEEGVPFIKGKHISGGRIDFGNCDFISREDHERVISRSKAECGDTLFSNIGSVGDAAFVATTEEFSIKNIALFKPNPNVIDPRYLFYLVSSPNFREGLLAKRSGSAQPFISLSVLREHRLRFHGFIPTQRRVASILSAYDDLIENNTRRIAILEEMARRIYEEWFVHFRFPGHQEVKMVETELGLVPEGWRMGRLDDLMVLQRGFDLPTSARHPGPFPVYAASGQHGWHEASKVKGPGVITGRSGSLGVVTYAPSDFWPLNTTLWVKDFKLGSPVYCFYVLSAMDLEAFNSGAAVPTLNRNDIHGLPTLLPADQVLTAFDTLVMPMVNLKTTLLSTNANLRAQRDLLLPKLISGEIDVSELPDAAVLEAAE